jgi:hypothetical protein
LQVLVLDSPEISNLNDLKSDRDYIPGALTGSRRSPNGSRMLRKDAWSPERGRGRQQGAFEQQQQRSEPRVSRDRQGYCSQANTATLFETCHAAAGPRGWDAGRSVSAQPLSTVWISGKQRHQRVHARCSNNAWHKQHTHPLYARVWLVMQCCCMGHQQASRLGSLPACKFTALSLFRLDCLQTHSVCVTVCG